jgi:cation diffusion facilitator family transporter
MREQASMQHGNRRAIIAALLANFGIAIAKFVGYGFTGAASLLAETVHSIADTGNQALLLWGHAASVRGETESHPFGYGRERYFWAFVVSLVIFSLGSLFAIYQGTVKLLHPHTLTDPQWAIGILLVGILLEGWSFRTAVTEARKVKGDASWWTYIRHSKSPELPVVVLEDFGALCGLVLALAGIALAMITGDPRFDAIGSITIGVLLGIIATVLAIEMKSLLIGEAAAPAHLERIRDAVESLPTVRRLIHFRTQHTGPDQLLLGAKVEFDGALDVARLSDAIDAVEATIRKALPFDVTIYIEPDIYELAQDESIAPGRKAEEH